MRSLSGVILALMTLSSIGCGRGEEPSTVEKAAAAAVRGVHQGQLDSTWGRLDRWRLVLERYSIDHGEFPAGDSLAGIDDMLVPTYTPRTETRDAWGHTMTYISDGNSYTIVSVGADGAAGTSDDITLEDGTVTGGS